ncbi:MAG: glycosyltransferase family 2 protein [Ginsengibacter sp.]
MDKVIAVVVTYNRQLLLTQCIDALRNQTRKIDKILVVNNGSTDNTESWLRNQHDLEFITQDNVGGAGGFFTGIKTAFEKSYTWIWLMDDDGYPKEDALEMLLDGDDEEMCLRNCSVIDKEDKKSFVWKTGIYSNLDEVENTVINNVAHPFNGTLLHRKIVERVGFPKANLFLWGDETEYFYRIIRKNKIPYYTKANSVHYHPASAYSYKNDWNLATNWKMYFYIRNRFSILKTKFSNSLPLAITMYVGFIVVFAGTIVVFQKTNKLKKLSFMLWPMTDAFTNNFEANPSFILHKIS